MEQYDIGLLSAEEIEEKLLDTQAKIADLDYNAEVLIRSPAISDKECRRRIGEANKNLEGLQIDFIAYQTALEADPFDYT
jgi:hypothetical protein